MKRITLLFATILFMGLSVQIGFAQDAKDKNRQLLINITKFLEENPFDEKAESARKNAFTFVAQTKDVTVVMCTDLTKEALKKKNKYGGELLIQYSLGMAAYKLENPDKKDENAAQLAGLESMLKSYEVMFKEKPDAKFPAMDELLNKRDNGELKALVEQQSCGKKKK